MAQLSFYDVLGVEQDADAGEIKRAYRRALKHFHSDVGGTDRQTRMFNEAYRVLSDPDARADYDRELAGEPTHDTSTADNDSGSAGAQTPPEPEPEPWGTDDEWDEEDTQQTVPGPGPQPRRGRPTWHTVALLKTPVQVFPSFDQALRAYQIALAVWGAITVATLVVFVLDGGAGGVIGPITIALMLIPTLPPLLNHPGLETQFNKAGYVAAVVLLVYGAGTPTKPVRGVFAWLCVLAFIAAVVLAKRRAKIVALNRQFGPTETLEYNRWGQPGQHSSNQVARYAARSTEQQLQPLYDIPGAKILHGVAWPGRPDLGIDHGVLCGDRLALISSQAWQPGTYTMDNYGNLLRNGFHYPGGEIYLPHAAGAWHRQLPNLQVAAFVIAHPSDPGAGLRVHITPSQVLSVLTAETVAEHIGAWIAPAAGSVDRYTLARLLS